MSRRNGSDPLENLAESPQVSRVDRYLRFLARKWWLVALTIIACVGGQAYVALNEPTEYSSFARLMVGGKVKLPEGGLFSEEALNFFGTQIELMQSEKIKERAHAAVKAAQPEINRATVQLQVTQIRRTSIFQLKATSLDGAYAQAFLNALVDEYLAYKKEMRAVASDDTLATLTAKLLQQDKELKSDQEKLHQFKKANNVALLQEMGSAAGNYLARLTRLTTQLSDLQVEEKVLAALSTEENVANQMKARGGDSKLVNDSVTVGLLPPADYLTAKQQAQLLKFQRDEWGQVMRPEHPKMAKLAEDIARVEKLTEVYHQQSREQLESARRSVGLRITSVEASILTWEAKVLEANTRMADFDQIKATVARSQSLYDHLLRLLQNVDVNKNLEPESIVQLERATLAAALNQLPLKLAVAATVGLLLGLGLLVVWERRDDRLSSLNELREQFQETVVAQVPQVPGVSRRRPLKPISANDERSIFAESIRHVYSSLQFRDGSGRAPKYLLITSAVPDEGKSTISANLAMTMALAGSRVLLIDTDLTRGGLHQTLGTPVAPGLVELFTQGLPFEKVIASVEHPNLHLIPRGQMNELPHSFYLNPAQCQQLKEWAKPYDYVVFDSAPVFAGADAVTLAPQMDGVFIVVRRRYSRAGLLTQALEMLYQRRAKVLGLVFNRAAAVSDVY
jgi:capsular exopolysaccharide synthesis family protein